MTHFRHLTVIALVFVATTTLAQPGGVAISPSGAPADPSAMLDVNSTSHGTLITRLTTVQRDAINNPALSLTIFNTTTNCFEFHDGASWVTLSCGCQVPAAPPAITGPSEVCQGQSGVAYSIPSLPHAIGYVWSLPPGATVASGSNTSSILVDFAPNAQPGTLSVHGYSASCGNGPVGPGLSVQVDLLPAAAGAITGPGTVCQGQTGLTYSISPVAQATSYQWSYSGTGVEISGNGASVNVDISPWATPGELSVQGINGCGAGVASPPLPLTLGNLPAAAGPITGSPTPCAFSSNQPYSVAPVAGATSYLWSAPSGSAVSENNGASALLQIGNASGQVVVTPQNACGTGTPSSLWITPSTLPGTPSGISGSTFLTASANNAYSVSSVSGATSYTWNITPAGATIAAGQGSQAISVTYPSVTTAYTVCVTASNGCGTSAAACTGVQVFTGRQAFSATGGNQTFNVPSGVNQVFVKLWGAGGGGGINYSGGAGAFVSGHLSVTPSSALNVIVGGKGLRASGTAATPGGFGGGGASGASNNVNGFAAGSGGGRSAIQLTPGTDAVTAGGGGGCGTGNSGQNEGSFGGGGGAPNGSAGGDNKSGTQGGPGAGKGGTTTSGGAGTTALAPAVNSSAGGWQTGSAGASAPYAGGGGGGGYYGGSGGAGSTDMTVLHAVGGGGGGSSYTALLSGNITNLPGNHGATVTGTIAAPNASDVDYLPGVGTGGYYSNNGGDGLVVFYW